jgi:hypothetical protein
MMVVMVIAVMVSARSPPAISLRRAFPSPLKRVADAVALLQGRRLVTGTPSKRPLPTARLRGFPEAQPALAPAVPGEGRVPNLSSVLIRSAYGLLSLKSEIPG